MKNRLFNNATVNYEKYLIIKNYPKNALVFNEGNACNELAIIIEGSMMVSTLTYNNKEYVINTLTTGDIFGDTLLFSKNNQYLGDGISLTPIKIAYISKNNLLELFRDQNILQNYLNYVCEKTLTIKNQVKLLSQKNIRERILFFLQNEQKKNHTNVINIKSKEELAKVLNIPRPSLSRELMKLKNEKKIDFDRQKIILML